MNEELKACTFCGASETGIHSQEHMGYCMNCGAFGPSRGNKQDAADAWNNRPLECDLSKRISGLEAEVSRLNIDNARLGKYVEVRQELIRNTCHYFDILEATGSGLPPFVDRLRALLPEPPKENK